LKQNQRINKQTKENYYDFHHKFIRQSKWLIKKRSDLKIWHRTRFLQCLLLEPSEGLSTTQLETRIPCHRDTVNEIGKELIQEGIVTNKNGKYGSYQLSDKVIYKDPILMANLFRVAVMTEVMQEMVRTSSGHIPVEKKKAKDRRYYSVSGLDKHVSVIPRFWDELERNFMGCDSGGKQIDMISNEAGAGGDEGFTIFQQRCNYCGHSQDVFLPYVSKEQRSLIEFALKIGISDIYVMLEGMRPFANNNKKNGFDTKKNHKKEVKKTSILPGAKKRRTELWVNNATIRPLDKLQEFMKLPIVKRGLAKPIYLEEYYRQNINPGLTEKKKKEFLAEHRFGDPNDPAWSPYEIDKESLRKLTETLRKTWSGLLGMFEGLLKAVAKTADDFDASTPRTYDTESASLKILQILINANANEERKKRHPRSKNVSSFTEKIYSLLMTIKKTEPENLDKALEILKKGGINKLPFSLTKLPSVFLGTQYE
jgi:hypothetical protein